MAYRVYYDDYLLYDPVMTDYKLINPNWSTELSKVGSFYFTIPVSHPNFEFLELMKPLVRIYRDGVLKFKGRIYKMTNDFYGNKRCECEDCMAFLNDSLVAPFSFNGTTGELFADIINWHNERVTQEQQIILGNVVGEDTIEVYRWQETYKSSLDCFKAKILEPFGGYLKLRYDANENPVVDFLKEITDTCQQHITYGKNLADHIIDENAKDFATAVVPLGIQRIELDPDSHDETRITIEEVNGGKDYLVNEDLASVYGIIYQKTALTTHPSVRLPETLLEHGYRDLAKAVVYKRSVQVTMADLGFIEDVNSPETGQNIIIDSAPHGGTVSYLLRRMEVDLSNPAMTEITLGDEKESFLAKTQKAINDITSRVTTIENTYLTEAQNIAEVTIQNNTSILQSAEEIILQALQNYVKTQDYESTMSTIATQLEVMAGQINFNFQTTTEQYDGVQGQFSNIEKYIRFIDGDIVLGTSDSAVKLKISNNIMYFFSGADDVDNTDNAFAYFSDGELVVNDVRAKNSLTIGNFYWQPEDNGSLSLVYNGT